MTAEAIAKALGGRKAGGGWTARCPAHDDHTPSLSIRDADESKVLVRCHAGCDQEHVIAALRSRPVGREWLPPVHAPAFRGAAKRTEPDQDDAKRTEAALAIWQAAKPAEGTPVESYLVSRGLDLPPPRRSASMPA